MHSTFKFSTRQRLQSPPIIGEVIVAPGYSRWARQNHLNLLSQEVRAGKGHGPRTATIAVA